MRGVLMGGALDATDDLRYDVAGALHGDEVAYLQPQ